ncbi:uncharacterized protein Ga0609869_001547 [Rhodovulum iodosum]|uniref:DUF1127 domain-containing protein n=1 Tax=Rhodovulum iodosum TaxID=68291 RepID=A0ABV3XSZ4_9RHOB|nr:hypothetical protein [Rhodovulum robiginosum]RSK30521.1 hypothetical protein EJA01_17270 [Rhodovulum robiginosum]
MATPSITFKFSPPGMSQRIDAFFAGLGQGVNAYVLSRSRMREIQRLNSYSDAQLSQLGITREDIPRYVFRDLFNL